MANVQGMASSFKSEILSGIHALGTTVTRGGTGADVIKAALFLASASVTAATATYTTSGEVTGAGYPAGGVVVTNANSPSTSGTTGIWTPSASIVYTAVTLSVSFDAVQLYNSSQSNKAISVHTFGAQTVSGTFTLTLPVNDAANALIRIV